MVVNRFDRKVKIFADSGREYSNSVIANYLKSRDIIFENNL